MDLQKAYSILGLSSDASEEEVKKSYRSLVKKYHPDRSQGNEAKFMEVQKAYEYLKENKSKAVLSFTHRNIFDLVVER